MRTTYRMRAGRFLGILAAGLIILGVAAVLWALGLPGVAVSVFVTLGGLIAIAGLWILARPPLVARLRDREIEVRGLRTAWTDITEVGRVETTHGEAIVLRTKNPDHPVLLPVSWLAPGRAEELEIALRDKLNAAHGYTIWDGTAPGDAGDAE
ncbi:hypothetical protein [Kribbella sp. NPDC003557]|uniref:hypothetical protein n=1 Tax=Kribbella sp. NPDC003557 TaxID=3154449 RepID=UPI0033AF0A71